MKKTHFRCRVGCLLGFLMMLVNGANAQTWGSPVIIESPSGTGGSAGQFSSIVIVNGNPAIAYYDLTHQSLMYVRANDPNGFTWHTPMMVDANGLVGEYASLFVVNGNPAIAYHDETNSDLKFVRATDVNGTAWGTPVTVDAAGAVGEHTSLKVVNGNPAISYYDNTTDDLLYVRATDMNGTAWGTPVTVDGATDVLGQYTSLCVVSGSPAISYYDLTNSSLKYVRALDLTGALWDTPQTLDLANTVGQHTSMAIVNGNPAIAYYDFTNTNLRYIRASDALGSAWNAPVDADNLAAVGTFCALAVVNGNPAISYHDASVTGLAYVRASDANGTGWGTPVSVDGAGSGSYGQYTAIGVVNGNPAISYYDGADANLRYVRATDADGTTWGTPFVFDITPVVGEYTSLLKVNTHPAVAYYDVTNQDLKYVRAVDPAGAMWGLPITIDATGDVGQYLSMALVNGRPAISYYDETNQALKYVHAADVFGLTWGTPIDVDVAGNPGGFTSLKVINGRPAITYYDFAGTALKYIQASDINGATWSNAPVVVDNSLTAAQYSALAFINGAPAVSYYTSGELTYIRATDPDGTTWGAAVSVDADANVGHYSSLTVVNGNPAISYYDVDSSALKYVRAMDADGSSWGAAAWLDGMTPSPVLGQYSSMEVVAGKPAISYYDQTNSKLKYIHASDANGTAWDAPVDLANTGDQGKFSNLSMLAPGVVGIAFYDATKDWPMFMSGTLVCMETTSSISPVSCDDYVSPSGNYLWTSSNTYVDTIPNMTGCDSVITVNLTIVQSTSSAINVTSCDSLVSPSGNFTWFTTGAHLDVVPNSIGCDSIITVNLTINNSEYFVISPIACDSYTSPSGLYTWTSSNTYYDTLATLNGCDSVIQVDLQILTANVGTTVTGFDITAMDALATSYQWLDCNNGMAPIAGATGQTYAATANGDYAVIIDGLNGCVDTSACVNISGIGIGENGLANGMAVYPNPVNDITTIYFAVEVTSASMRVMDIQGNMVRETMIINGKTWQVDLSDLAGGMYVIEVREGDAVYHTRISKN